MHRRGPDERRRLLLVLPGVVIAVALLAFTILRIADRASEQPDAGPVTTVTVDSRSDVSDTDRTLTTVSDFYPEDSNLSDCLGLVEKPGCGSKARGGWRQTAVFGFLVAGLGLIVWRISVGVRTNRERTAPDERSTGSETEATP